jgi:hypothetical protein
MVLRVSYRAQRAHQRQGLVAGGHSESILRGNRGGALPRAAFRRREAHPRESGGRRTAGRPRAGEIDEKAPGRGNIAAAGAESWASRMGVAAAAGRKAATAAPGNHRPAAFFAAPGFPAEFALFGSLRCFSPWRAHLRCMTFHPRASDLLLDRCFQKSYVKTRIDSIPACR